MSYTNYFLRKFINKKNQRNLRNKDFSIFSSNCNGCCICHDLGLQFRSPFVNLSLDAKDYIQFLKDPKSYLDVPLEFEQDSDKEYPVGRLKDITIYFVHYHSQKEAREAWERRKERIDWDNLFVLMTDRDGCTEELLQEFDALPYRNKVVFTHLPMPNICSAVYIPGFEKEKEVGNGDAGNRKNIQNNLPMLHHRGKNLHQYHH